MDHLEDGAHAAPLLAEHAPEGAAVLDLARRVAAVAELVLQALNREGVAGAVLAHPRHQEAGEAAPGLGEGEEGVAHRRRAEPLVADQEVLGAGTARGDGRRPRGVGAHVAAALLLGHRHADEGGALLGEGDEARIVLGAEERGLPGLGDLLLVAQRRHAGERHGERAAGARLDLRELEQQRAARHLRAGQRLAPREVVDRRRHGEAHHLVPRGVERDLVDPVPEAIVGAQLGRMAIRLAAEREDARAAERLAEGRDPRPEGAAALARQAFREGRVRLEPVHVLEGRRLVRHLVGRPEKLRLPAHPSPPPLTRIASSSTRALSRLSRHSAAGSESATMPPPVWTKARPPATSALRITTERSAPPRRSK